MAAADAWLAAMCGHCAPPANRRQEQGGRWGSAVCNPAQRSNLHPVLQMSEPVGDFLRGGGWRGSPRWQPSSPRFGVAAEFGVRSPEMLPRAPTLAYCTLQVMAPGAWASVAWVRMWCLARFVWPVILWLWPCRSPVCICPSFLQTRFGDVLDLLVARHLHRVFICDAEMRPAGVLSCTDILRLIAGPAD